MNKLLIIGLIVYVVLSAIGEMAKRKPMSSPGRPKGVPRFPQPGQSTPTEPFGEAWEEEGRGMEGSLTGETGEELSEYDAPSLEGEDSQPGPAYESAEGESMEGVDEGGESFEGSSLEAVPPEKGQGFDRAVENGETWWEESDDLTEEGLGFPEGREQESIFRTKEDILKGVILSEVLQPRSGRFRRGLRR